MFKLVLLFLVLMLSSRDGGRAQLQSVDPLDDLCLRAYSRRMESAKEFAESLRELERLVTHRQRREVQLNKAR